MEYTLFFLLLFILENTAAHTIILDKAKVVKEKTEEKMIKIAEKKRLEENIILAESDIEIALPNLFQKDIEENKLQEASDAKGAKESDLIIKNEKKIVSVSENVVFVSTMKIFILVTALTYIHLFHGIHSFFFVYFFFL